MPARRFLVSCFLVLSIVNTSAISGISTSTIPGYDWEYFAGNFQFTLLHELGHAFITQSNLPVFGNEEIAADELATAVLLLADPIDAPQDRVSRLLAAADGWLLEWALEQQADTEIPYWDNRPLKIQRFYRIVCSIYGSDPETYARYNWHLRLPYERSFSCIDDYRGIVKKVTWLRKNGETPHANAAGRTRRKLVHTIFEAPANSRREHIANLLRDSKIIDKSVTMFTKLFPLPKEVTVVLANGCGAGAYWRDDLDEIILCYELVEQFMYLARFRHCVEHKPSTTPVPRVPDNVRVRRCVDAMADRVWLPHWPVPPT